MHDLFNDAFDANHNLLPYDGKVNYYGAVLSDAAADTYFNALHKDIPWQHDQVRIAGQVITTARQVAWYGDAAFAYTYSGMTKHALPWTPALLELKALVEQHTGQRFNSCLLNLYENGTQGMAWHSDDETALGNNPAIAALSLGAVRTLAFKHKTSRATVKIELAHGSLLLMHGTTQAHWLHRLPPTTKVHQPRISLTFRTIFNTNITRNNASAP